MLCSQEWYKKHKDDYTEEDIAALGIEITVDKRKFPKIRQGGNKGKVGKLLKIKGGNTNGMGSANP